MNLNNNCSNLMNKYVSNDEDFDSCLQNVFSVECPKNLDDCKDESERQRCEEQFNFLGWKDSNRCWFSEFDGIPTNNFQFNKLSKKEKNECNKLFQASSLNLEKNIVPNDNKPWSTPLSFNKQTLEQRKGRLCPRNKKKFLSLSSPLMASECSFIYENGIVDDSAQGGCAIFDNEWLECGEDQHYNTECTKCIDD